MLTSFFRTKPAWAALLLLMLEWAFSLGAALVGGAPATILSYLAYLVPLSLFLLFGCEKGELQAHRPTAVGFRRILPLLPLFLASVMLVSAITGWLMACLGLPQTGGAAGEGAFWSQVLTHAALPALLEEALLRLCILSLLSRTSPAQAVPQTALLFALMHGSLYQLPYALVGGLFLGLATATGGSFLFAVLFHFCNNLLSLFMQALPQHLGEVHGLYANLALAFLLFLSAAWGAIVLLRRQKQGPTPPPAAHGWLRTLVSSPLLIYMLLMLLYACL